MSLATQRDIGALITTRNAFNPNTLNANSTAENNVWLNGVAIDRQTGTPDKTLFLSGKVSVPFSYSLAAAATLTMRAQIQDGATSTAWTNITDKDGSTAASKAIAATTASQTGHDVLEFDVNLAKARRYVRIRVKATFSGTTTADDADTAGILIMGGADNTPAVY